MSKSKKNTVDPSAILQRYGADAARLFMMSDSPPERDLEWSDAGIDGAARYMNRLWRLLQQLDEAKDVTPLPDAEPTLSEPLKAVYATVHKTIKQVGEDVEQFHFNKAVARIRELTNTLAALDATTPEAVWVLQTGLEAAIHLMAPFMPHLAEEMWKALGNDELVAERPWPHFNPALVVEDTVTVAVQVNGKLRATIQLPRDTDQQTAQTAAMEEQNVQQAVAGKQVVKTIVVPNRIVNVVVK